VLSGSAKLVDAGTYLRDRCSVLFLDASRRTHDTSDGSPASLHGDCGKPRGATRGLTQITAPFVHKACKGKRDHQARLMLEAAGQFHGLNDTNHSLVGIAKHPE
jgi:hypothetical protein